MSRAGRKIWLYRSTIVGRSSMPTTSITASIRRPLGGRSPRPVQLGHELVPRHDVPLVPRQGGLRLHLLVHGRRGSFILLVPFHLGRGLPLLDSRVVGGRRGVFVGGRVGGRGLRRAGPALLAAAAAAPLLAALFSFRRPLAGRRGFLVLGLVERLGGGAEFVGILGHRIRAGVVERRVVAGRLVHHAGAEIVGFLLNFRARVA